MIHYYFTFVTQGWAVETDEGEEGMETKATGRIQQTIESRMNGTKELEGGEREREARLCVVCWISMVTCWSVTLRIDSYYLVLFPFP